MPDINSYMQMQDGTWRARQSLDNPHRGERRPIPQRDNRNLTLLEDKSQDVDKGLAQANRVHWQNTRHVLGNAA